MQYRRADVKDGTYFFMANLAQRHLRLLLDHVEILREAVKTVKQRHVDYIHYNPVKHGHVSQASEWPYSSIHRYIKAGIIANDWGGGIDSSGESGYGER